MKQFDLEEYLKNPNMEIVTRDGRKVRIICTDKKGTDFPIIGLVDLGHIEETNHYTKNGYWCLYDTENMNDLVFASEKHEGWINLYLDYENKVFCGFCIHNSKEEAEKFGKESSNYITTSKIEWEE